MTTRRMIFQAEGGTFFRSRISKEISLDKVTGVDCYYGVNMKITQIIVGVILTILGFMHGELARPILAVEDFILF